MDELVDIVILGALHAQDPEGKALGLELSDYLDDEELPAARITIRDTLAAEVSPGVTLGDAVRAYLAIAENDWNEMFSGPDGWTVTTEWGETLHSAPTLAAAILAAAGVDDAE